MIEIKDLTKQYKGKNAVKTAVDHLSLTVQTGELFALLGVNGAGKTTTIRMLTGIASPTTGNATLDGYSICTELNAVKQIIGVSPQETAVAPNLTVMENMELLAGICGYPKAVSKEKIETLLQDFSLSDVASQRAKTLSGGYARRLSIALALLPEPKILFLDEPTLGLDVLARRELWRVIEKLKGKMTVILTTHYMEEAEALSDRVGIMRDGKLLAVGSAQELIAASGQSTFEDAFIAFAEGRAVINAADNMTDGKGDDKS